jgi:hypothetical protein
LRRCEISERRSSRSNGRRSLSESRSSKRGAVGLGHDALPGQRVEDRRRERGDARLARRDLEDGAGSLHGGSGCHGVPCAALWTGHIARRHRVHLPIPAQGRFSARGARGDSSVLPIATLMGPLRRLFAGLMGPPDRQGHGATREGHDVISPAFMGPPDRQGHGATPIWRYGPLQDS